MATNLTTLEKDQLLRLVARLAERVATLERTLSGVPVSTVRIADLSVTNAKIDSVSVDKLTAGNLIVDVNFGDAENMRFSGEDNAIYITDIAGDDRILLGKGDFTEA